MNAEDGWEKIGLWLAQSFNKMIKEVEAGDMAQTISDLVIGLLDLAIKFLTNVDWEETANKIADILVNIDWLGIITRVIEVIAIVFYATETMRKRIKERIAQALWEWIKAKIGELGNLIGEKIEELLLGIGVKCLGIITTLTEVWQKVKNWWSNNVAPKLKAEYWATKVSGVATGLKNGFKSAFNGIISIVERAINKIIKELNRLHWETPDWLPNGLGGKKFGFNLEPITITPLASGGVVNNPSLILAGEYAGASQNPEIVAPQKLLLETSTQANIPVMNAIEEMGDKLVSALDSIGVYAEFDYSKLKVGLDNENYRVGGKLYGI